MDIGNETEDEIHTEEPAPEEEIVGDDLSQTEKRWDDRTVEVREWKT